MPWMNRFAMVSWLRRNRLLPVVSVKGCHKEVVQFLALSL
jgi:hypothetical protein